jgi:poly-gamma-glutamate biosynthesis protein PgsC/CapC
MHNYGAPTEIVRMALALGVIISILIYERWRVTGGAAVVAGYLALFVNRPVYIITTVLLAVITHQIVQHFIARRVFLYGRRRLVVMVLIGMALQILTGTVAYALNLSVYIDQTAPWVIGLYGVGFVLPGLIALDIERQGARLTVLTVLGTSLLTFLVLRNLEAIKTNLPIFWNSIAFEDKTIYYSYHTQLLIPAVILSVLVSALLYEWLEIRSGGFLTAGYAALFVLQPLHLIFIAGVSILVFVFVTRFLMRQTPIFGRTKFAMMVLSGLVFTWGLEVLTARVTQSAFIPFAGFSIISPMITALIANDGERQGLGKTLLGVVICTLVVFAAIKGVDLLLIK